jgi:hypothetical protein
MYVRHYMSSALTNLLHPFFYRILWVVMCIAVTRLQLNLLRVVEPLTKTTVIETSHDVTEKYRLDRLDGQTHRIACGNHSGIMFSRSAIMVQGADEDEWSENVLTPTIIAPKDEEEDDDEYGNRDLGAV